MQSCWFIQFLAARIRKYYIIYSQMSTAQYISQYSVTFHLDFLVHAVTCHQNCSLGMRHLVPWVPRALPENGPTAQFHWEFPWVKKTPSFKETILSREACIQWLIAQRYKCLAHSFLLEWFWRNFLAQGFNKQSTETFDGTSLELNFSFCSIQLSFPPLHRY